MFNILEKYLRKKGSLSESEINTIIGLGDLKKVQKKQILLRGIETKRYTTFVCSGCLQICRISDTGTEHIIRFAPRNCWVDDFTNFCGEYTGGHFVGAIVDSEVIQWNNQTFENLQREIPRFRELYMQLRGELIEECYNRIFTLISLDAKDKYRDYIKTFPELHGRIPLTIVATYLGMTRETLTRLRNNPSFSFEESISSKQSIL